MWQVWRSCVSDRRPEVRCSCGVQISRFRCCTCCMHGASIFMQTHVHTENAMTLKSTPHAILVVKLYSSHHQMQKEIPRSTPSYRDRERKKNKLRSAENVKRVGGVRFPVSDSSPSKPSPGEREREKKKEFALSISI